MSLFPPEQPSTNLSPKSSGRFNFCLKTEWITLRIRMEEKIPVYVGMDDEGPLACDIRQEESGDLMEFLGGILAGRLSYCGPLPVHCTGFQKIVLDETRKIPYGEVRSYGEIAKKTGKPGGARAVGRALAQNPLPLLIPCHRVVGANGRLTGYSMGGTAIKQALLGVEQERRAP